MNCTKCNAALTEDQIYCPECGDQFAVNEQRAKVGEAFANTKNIISNLSSMYSNIYRRINSLKFWIWSRWLFF